jgi:drug/metabolite transporter (DMT)-like permease
MVFRIFSRFRVDLIQVIAVNYWVCVGCGIIWRPDIFSVIRTLPDNTWLLLAGLLGTLFISIFFFVGKAAQQIGVGYTTMITKVSMLIPAIAGILFFQEQLSLTQWTGVGITIIAIILIHLKYLHAPKPVAQHVPADRFILIAVVLFFGSGLCDSLIKFFDYKYAASVPGDIFTLTLFGAAAVWGLIFNLYGILTGRIGLRSINIIAGILLGIPNFFSVITMLLALRLLPGTVFFPINNIGLLAFATLVSRAVWRESLPVTAVAGLLLAGIAIWLLTAKI